MSLWFESIAEKVNLTNTVTPTSEAKCAAEILTVRLVRLVTMAILFACCKAGGNVTHNGLLISFCHY